MKLLVELANDQEVEVLIENTAQGKKCFLEGKWAAIDEEVRNGRTYPSQVMEGALAKYNQDFITTKRALGELNHPANPTVNLDRASHIIEKLGIQSVGGKSGVYGKARILESTPMGAIAKALIEEGVRLGVSTRGLGSIVERNGKKFVHNDFMLNAIDIVSDPSGPGCYPNAMFESIDYQMLEDGRIIQLAVDKAKKKINEEVLLKEMSKLMLQLTGK
jgi:hypothetical protein